VRLFSTIVWLLPMPQAKIDEEAAPALQAAERPTLTPPRAWPPVPLKPLRMPPTPQSGLRLWRRPSTGRRC
jgi:hypothetical protein